MKQVWLKSMVAVCGMMVMLSMPAAARLYTFAINAPREIDNKNADEIFSVRRKMLKKYPIFFSGTYDPKTSTVFSRVEDGKPWWGVKGLVCYGSGPLSTEGVSEETRFIDNPFLLIGVQETGFFRLQGDKKGNCPVIYPKPSHLTFNDQTRTFSVTYSVSNYLKDFDRLAKKNKKDTPNIILTFNGQNAIDFGVPYIFASQSHNIDFTANENVSVSPRLLQDFVHVDNNCGIEGGCNDGGPDQMPLQFRVSKYPADITFKLWKKKPESAADAPFLIYKIRIQ